MMRSIVSNWTPWYVNESGTKVTCYVRDNSFMKKNVQILRHVGHAYRNGKKDAGVRLYKNMKPKEGCVF